MNAPLRRLFLSFALLLFLTAAAPRRAALPSLSESIEVSIVNVDAVVTDRDGNRVRGLTADDFVILEDGQVRDISNFAEYATPDAATAISGSAAAAQKRTVAIFIERANLLPDDANDLVEALRRAVHDTVREGDNVSLIFWSVRAQSRADFDGRELATFDRVLDVVKEDLIGPPGHSIRRREDELADFREFHAAIAGVDPEAELNDSFSDVSLFAAQLQLADVVPKIHAINAVINSIAAEDGKKILLLGTHRIGKAGRDQVFVSPTDILSRDERYRFQTRDLIDSVILNANAAEVTVYPVYPSGVASRPGAAPFVGNLHEMESLQRIARATGGLESSGTWEFGQVIPRIQADLSDYYSLAYHLDSTRGDRRRELTVKTRNPEYRVRARRSYIEKSDDTRMKDRLMMALQRSPGPSSFSIDASVGAPARRGPFGVVPLTVRIPVEALTLIPQQKGSAGAFSLYLLAGDSDQGISEIVRQTQRVELSDDDLQELKEGYFTYDVSMRMLHNTNRLAVGVLDEVSGFYGVVRLPVERESR